MLDEVIDMVDRLKLKAEGINKEIVSQKEMLKRINNKAEKARKNLQKRSNAL